MGYATGQITASATPIQDLVAEMETLLTAHPAWSFIEIYDESATWRHRIWKNDGLQNDWGEDFYLSISYNPSSETILYLKPFEVWDAVTKGGKRGSPNPALTITPEATFASYRGDTVDTALGNANFFSNNLDISVNTIDFNWWCIVTKNGIFVDCDQVIYGNYAGLFESFIPDHPQEFPLVSWEMGYADVDGAGSVNRRPGETASMSDAFAIWSHAATSGTIWTQTEGAIPSGIGLYGGGSIGSRFTVFHSNPGNGGRIRGLMYDALYFLTDVAVDVGDTITINAETYVYFGQGLWVNTDAV